MHTPHPFLDCFDKHISYCSCVVCADCADFQFVSLFNGRRQVAVSCHSPLPLPLPTYHSRPLPAAVSQPTSCPLQLSWFCLKTHFSSVGKTNQKCQRRLFCPSLFGHFSQFVSLSLSPLCHCVPLYHCPSVPTVRLSVSSLFLVIGACSPASFDCISSRRT